LRLDSGVSPDGQTSLGHRDRPTPSEETHATVIILIELPTTYQHVFQVLSALQALCDNGVYTGWPNKK